MTPDVLLSAGIASAVTAGIFTLLQVLFNKKLRSPADNQATKDAAILERNQIIEGLKTDIKGLKNDLKELTERVETVETENDQLKNRGLATNHYIYRCIGVIERLGGEIPMPLPEGIK